MFKNPFSFNGRIRRLEYGLSLIIFYAYLVIVSMFMSVPMMEYESEYEMEPGVAGVYLLIMIPAYWFMISQGAKRCHDRGNSGWFQLIPFYGFWMLFADGERGVNMYGPNPKGVGNLDDIDTIGQHLQ